MKVISWKYLVAFCGVMMVLGCSPYQFDQQRYEEIVEEESPTPNVDEDHDWMMTTTKTLVVDPSGVTDVQLIRIFTENPAVTDFAEIVGGAYSSGDSKVVMNISYPIRLETLYAAAIDSEGYYTIVPFSLVIMILMTWYYVSPWSVLTGKRCVSIYNWLLLAVRSKWLQLFALLVISIMK